MTTTKIGVNLAASILLFALTLGVIFGIWVCVQHVTRQWEPSKSQVEIMLGFVLVTASISVLNEVLSILRTLIVALCPKGAPRPYDKRYTPPRSWMTLQ